MRRAVFIIAWVFPVLLQAQVSDFQGWYSVSVKASLNDKTALVLSNECRTYNNASWLGKNLFEAGISRKAGKNAEASLFARFTTDDPASSDRYHSLRYFGQFSLKQDAGRFGLSMRIRLGTDDDQNMKGMSWEHREKLSADYNIKGLPVNPELSCELFFPLSQMNYGLSKARFMAGLEWKMSKNHRLGVSYGFQHRYKDLPENDYLLDISYRYSFKIK